MSITDWALVALVSASLIAVAVFAVFMFGMDE